MSYEYGLGQRIRYKLGECGVRDTLRHAYQSLTEAALIGFGRAFPSVYISPRSMQIEATTRCNLKCTHCELSYWTEVAADLRLPEFVKMMDHVPKLRRLELTGIGEPLMNRDFYKIVEYAKSRGIRIEMVDNFTMMTEKAARRVIDLGVDRICLSLDGSTKVTFEKIRVGADFDKVIRNARRLVDLKRQLGRRKPEIMANFVATADNYGEATTIVELVHDIGIRFVHFDCVVTFDKTNKLGTEGVGGEFRRSLERAADRARELGIFVKWVHFEENVPIQQCTRPQRALFVTRDGFIHPCCLTTQTGDRQAQNRRSIGNLIDESIEQVWRAKRYAGLRSKMQQGILPHECHMCPLYSGTPDSVHGEAAAAPLSQDAAPVVFVHRRTEAEGTTLSR